MDITKVESVVDFLKDFDKSVFQVFKDNKTSNVFPKIYLEYNEKEFRQLNKQGAGIYFTANFFEGGRKEKNLIGLNSIFGDLDVAKEGDGSTQKERDKQKRKITNALNGICKPHYIIDTKNGIQVLYLIECGKEEEDIKKFRLVENGLIKVGKSIGAKGDKVKDITRVLRLPYFNHMKDMNNPYMVNAFKLNIKSRYILDFLLSKFPYKEDKKEYSSKFNSVQLDGNDPRFDEIDNIPFQDLIIKMFARGGWCAEFDKQLRIKLNGRLTGLHQGKQENLDPNNPNQKYIASSSHECGLGGGQIEGNAITCTSAILGVSRGEAFQIICEEFGIKKWGELKKEKSVKKIVDRVEVKDKIDPIYDITSPFTWGTKILDNIISPIERNQFIVLVGATGAGKTAFCFDMAIKNSELGHKVLFISLEMDTEDVMTRLALTYAGISKAEWRDKKTIPKEKKSMYFEKKEEIRNKLNKNLILLGIDIDDDKDFNMLKNVILKIGNVDLVFVDNFDLVAGEKGQTENERETELSKNFMFLSKTYGIPTIIMHHFRKQGRDKEDKPKTMSEIKGSVKVTQCSSQTIQIWRNLSRDASECEKSKLMIIQMKDRTFGDLTSCVEVVYSGGTFVDIDYGQNQLSQNNNIGEQGNTTSLDDLPF